MTQPNDIPWPIENALGKLQETRDSFENSNLRWYSAEYSRGVFNAMNLAIEVVKGINTIREPQPPDPVREAEKAFRKLCMSFGESLEAFGLAMQDIGDGVIPDS